MGGTFARKINRVALKPAALLGLLMVGFIVLQCSLPLRTAVKIGADEDFELSKATLCLKGYQLYTQIWCDQPPLYVTLLTSILRHISPGILGPRLLTSGFVVLNWLTGNPLLLQFQQAWGAHVASARSLEYGSPEQHAFDWTVLLKNWDTSAPALVGVFFLARSGWPVKSTALPLVWLALTLVVFGTHKPWWSCYYVHNALPLCWCAGVGIAMTWHYVRARRSYVLGALLALYAVCASAWMGARLYLQEAGIRQNPKLYTCLALKEIERFKPFTTFIFTDQPIYSFHSGIPLPPRLAVLSLKRFWTGDISTAQVVAELESIKPGLIFLANDTRELAYQGLLNREYQLVYQDSANRLYAHRSIVRKAKY